MEPLPSRLRTLAPCWKAAPLPIAAMTAVAVTGPMPGIATSRRQASFSRAVFLITASASSIRICQVIELQLQLRQQQAQCAR